MRSKRANASVFIFHNSRHSEFIYHISYSTPETSQDDAFFGQRLDCSHTSKIFKLSSYTESNFSPLSSVSTENLL